MMRFCYSGSSDGVSSPHIPPYIAVEFESRVDTRPLLIYDTVTLIMQNEVMSSSVLHTKRQLIVHRN